VLFFPLIEVLPYIANTAATSKSGLELSVRESLESSNHSTAPHSSLRLQFYSITLLQMTRGSALKLIMQTICLAEVSAPP
jgi:hypothetical protein